MKKILDVELHNLQETAKIIGLGVPALRQAIRDKKLNARKIGNTFYVTGDDIKTFLNIN